MTRHPRGASAGRAARGTADAHGRQKVPGKDWSYVVHLTAVCGEILKALERAEGLDAELAVTCGLLHYTLEDTAVTRRQLAAAFGERVARGVAALSKDPSLPHATAMRDSLDRILSEPPEIAMVKMADRIVNLDPPPAAWTRSKISRYGAGAPARAREALTMTVRRSTVPAVV